MRIVARQKSADEKTTLYTQETVDGRARILTTYVDRPEKHIICFTTSIGCQVACQFCYAGTFVAPISAGELYQQVYLVHQDQGLHESTSRRGAEDKPVLFSAMGEGEPLATIGGFLSVTDALRTMGAVFPRARLALSTTGMNPRLIRELAGQRFPVDLKLQISLVSPRDDVRKSIMGTTAPLVDIRGAIGYYQEVSQGEVEWNLVLLDGVNDSLTDAREVARLLGPGAKVKLNGYNPVAGRNLARSPRALAFSSALSQFGLKPEIYQTDGWDIGAACGQFRATVVSLNELIVK
jgi:23S rRNA (adenine2503-C2)-methyltransferase